MSGSGKRCTASEWKRPTGPSNVWRIVEGCEKVPDEGNTRAGSSGATDFRFSIREVPEDRYQEAIEHMCKYFVADEATCKSLKLKEDRDAVDDFQRLWDYLLKIGISIGAYKLDENDTPIELAGMNVLFVVTDEIEKALEKFVVSFKSKKAKKLFKFMQGLSEKADVRDIYGVDKYISALGLSVAPAFRGQKLGVRLLEARNDIGRKYGITATSTIFTATPSQIQAERAGFECVLVQEYSQVRDDNGQLLFPDIESKVAKIMIKRLR
ncbi:uncharacterized protein LOC106637522 [Copidosoma floridanum]|uniref:uncharacterized protein LOC106637522 n=1 Tax=Copidosoma floridanum TaxID=29053 RepID=UPI0006C963D7|nr:uncharacterized protein LOC106637522 [Copidosoma floridanum]